jgi:V-type H+-transporting ATPase subunit A
MQTLEKFFAELEPEFLGMRTKMRTILQEETNLQEIVQLVGKESLSEDQKLSLEMAKIIREDFLQQNAFTTFDYMCPLPKTSGMMKTITTFYDNAMSAIEGSTAENRVTMESINLLCEDVKQRIIDSKQESLPRDPAEKIVQFFNVLTDDINAAFEKNFSY